MSRIQDALDQALALHYRGENRAAAAICQQILAMVPNEPGAMHLKGRIALDEGRAEEAVALMRKAIQRSPSSVAYHVDIGRAYTILERWTDAAASFQRALRLHKNHAEALIGLGRALLKQEKPQAAIEALERARAAAPDNPFALNELANTLLALDRPDEAATVLRRVIELVPESARAYLNLASCLGSRGDLDEAIGWLEKAITLDPSYRDAHETLASFHLSRAMVWLRDGRFDEGWQELEWRWKTKDYQRLSGGFIGTMWDGSDLGGGTILLHGEQGLGDESARRARVFGLPPAVGPTVPSHSRCRAADRAGRRAVPGHRRTGAADEPAAPFRHDARHHSGVSALSFR
jgi:tetratricopeptide (TPR) repeat protein